MLPKGAQRIEVKTSALLNGDGMSRHDKFWDLLDLAEREAETRRCPECGGEDCKYGTHNIRYRGFDLSIVCNDCGHSETAISPDYEQIINNCHKAI